MSLKPVHPTSHYTMDSTQKTPYPSAAFDHQVSRKHPEQRSDADREILRLHNESLPFMEECNKIYIEGRRVLHEAIKKSETTHQPVKDNSIGPRRISRETIDDFCRRANELQPFQAPPPLPDLSETRKTFDELCRRASELQPFQAPPPLPDSISEARKLIDERLKPKTKHASAPLTVKPTNLTQSEVRHDASV